MTFSIKKIKVRDGMFGYLEYDEVHADDQIRNEGTKDINYTMHDDFKEKLKALGIHCIFLTELLDEAKVKGDLEEFKHAMLENITVKGLSITENEGVTISFERKLKNKKVLNLNTPYTKYHDEAAPYRFNTELELAVSEVSTEALAYLNGEKYGVKQAVLPLEEPGAGGSDDTNPL